jgi:hypothetical protein
MTIVARNAEVVQLGELHLHQASLLLGRLAASALYEQR